jgi:hypothetical protein
MDLSKCLATFEDRELRPTELADVDQKLFGY